MERRCLVIAIIDYCEEQHVPAEQSERYQRNLALFGKEAADFYTYEIEYELTKDG